MQPSSDLAGRALLLVQDQPGQPSKGGSREKLVTLDNFERIARPKSRRRIYQVSALSTFVGSRHDHLGFHG